MTVDGLTVVQRFEEAMRAAVAVLADLTAEHGARIPRAPQTGSTDDDGERTATDEVGWPDAARWAPPPHPQASVCVFWCPRCGRRFPSGHVPGPTHYRQLGGYGRRRCEQQPIELVYRLDDASYRATITTAPQDNPPALDLDREDRRHA